MTTESSSRPSAQTRVFDKIVHHGGRTFLATTVMAAIFSARAEDVIARGDTELVPLLHQGGVELLLVAPHTVVAIDNVGVGLSHLGARSARSAPRRSDRSGRKPGNSVESQG